MANRSLFLEDYIFRGSYNEKAMALTSLIDKDSNSFIFNSLVELFMTAALVGCYYDRQSKPEKGDVGKKIFQSQFANHSKELNLIFRIVLLIGERNTVSKIDRLNRAFRSRETEENYSLLENFMLGGIDELYDTFILDKNNHYEDYLVSLSDFVNKFINENAEIFNDDPSTEDFF